MTGPPWTVIGPFPSQGPQSERTHTAHTGAINKQFAKTEGLPVTSQEGKQESHINLHEARPAASPRHDRRFQTDSSSHEALCGKTDGSGCKKEFHIQTHTR